MAESKGKKQFFVSHPASGLARSNFPMITEVEDGRIKRSLPFHVPDDVRLYEIRTTKRGTFTRPRKEVQMPLAMAHKKRVHSDTRVRYPLLREGWSPDKPNAGERGKGGYRRISWDEATDIVVQQLQRIKDKYGSMEPVFVQADGHGQSGYMQSLHFWGHYLFDMLQKKGWGWWTQQVRNPDSWEGYYWGAKHVWGFDHSLGEPFQDAVWDDVLEHCEMVIFSGCDAEATGLGMSGSIALHMPKWLKKAGIKIVAISPDLNYANAVHADTWIPLKPNTDPALYFGIAHTWIAEGTYDKDYIATHTTGFEEFRQHVMGEDDGVPKDPAWAEQITGVPARMIRALAREWAKNKTSLSVYFGGSKVRGTLSHLSTRMEAYVLSMQGIGKPGRQFLRIGAPSFYKKDLAQVPRYPEIDFKGLALNPMIEYAIGKGPVTPVFVPRTLAAEAINNGKVEWKSTTSALAKTEDQFVSYRYPPTDDHPGIRMVWNENGSQPGSWGHGNAWLSALQSDQIEFVVGIHPWLENDLPYSDLILPAQTNYEHEDLVIAQRSEILGMFYQEQAIEPVGESLSDYQIHRLIGHKLGLMEEFPTVDEWLKKAYDGTIAEAKTGLDWEAFKQKKQIIYDCPTWEEWVEIKAKHGFHEHTGGMAWFADKASGLDTTTGKIEFVSELIKKHEPDNKERPPLARWVEHPESIGTPKSKDYPLIVMSNHAKFRFHVQGDDISWMKEAGKVKGPDGYFYEACWINPEDAKARGISGGDIVKVFNERGAVLTGAYVTERIISGAVSIDHGAKMDLASVNNLPVDRGGCINLIAPVPGEKYAPGAEINVPEMNVSGFLVEIEKVDPKDIIPGTGMGISASVPA